MFHPRADTEISVEPSDRQSIDGFVVETAWVTFTDHLNRPARLYAARCIPPGNGRFPGVLHIPGGTQTVELRDLSWLARRGFAAVSFDWETKHISAHDPQRKSKWPAAVRPQYDEVESVEQAILPCAIGGASAVIDWLMADARVDADRIGVMGISWGGYLAWSVNAYDPRIRCAVPVFGCGGLFDPRHPTYFRRGPDEVVEVWRDQWDPLALAAMQHGLVCHLSCTNDFFGMQTHAERLLGELRVDSRRSHFPNGEHHVSPSEAALAEAWLVQHLQRGAAVPQSPQLGADWSIAADESTDWRVAERTVWWTPSPAPDRYRCWWLGVPPERRRARRAFARVRYENGVTLNSPLWEAEESAVATDTPPLPPKWPDAHSGVMYHDGLRSTRLYGTSVAWLPVDEDASRSMWRIDRDGGGPFSVMFAGLTDPAWNRGTINAIVCDLEAPGGQLEIKKVILEAEVDGEVGEFRHSDPIAAATRPTPDCSSRLTLRLEDFNELPPGVSWRQARRIRIHGNSSGNQIIIGPFEARGAKARQKP